MPAPPEDFLKQIDANQGAEGETGDEQYEQLLEAESRQADTQRNQAPLPAPANQEYPKEIIYKGQKYNTEELIRGGLRQQDYTKKTQELSAKEKAIEAERARYAEAIQRNP